jgi:aquaporin Z
MSDLRRKLTVEFIGTFFLMFTVGMATARAGTLAPLAIGSVLTVMVFAGGHISGGHYNPAVSTAVLLRGKLPARDYGAYVLTQLGAAAVAGLVVGGMGYAPTDALELAGSGAMLLAEFLFTFALAFVVLNVATAKDTEDNSYFGLAIGLTVAAGAFAVGSVSGGAFNPAVALGASVLGAFSWSHIWVYLIADFAGGAVAAVAFLSTQPAVSPAESEPVPAESELIGPSHTDTSLRAA